MKAIILSIVALATACVSSPDAPEPGMNEVTSANCLLDGLYILSWTRVVEVNPTPWVVDTLTIDISRDTIQFDSSALFELDRTDKTDAEIFGIPPITQFTARTTCGMPYSLVLEMHAVGDPPSKGGTDGFYIAYARRVGDATPQ